MDQLALFDGTEAPEVNESHAKTRSREAIEPPFAPFASSRETKSYDGRRWAADKIALWTRRAVALRENGKSAQAAGLEAVVRRLRGEWPDAGPAADQGEIERLRKQLEGWQMRFDTRLGTTLNDGPISAAIRARLEAQIQQLEAVG